MEKKSRVQVMFLLPKANDFRSGDNVQNGNPMSLQRLVVCKGQLTVFKKSFSYCHPVKQSWLVVPSNRNC